MRFDRAMAAPAVVPAPVLDGRGHRSFLSDVLIEHGPRDLLGRLFLQADTELRAKGIFLSFADMDELISVNRANADSWRPILPLFEPAVSDIHPGNSHAMLGRNAKGEVVCAHGCRYLDLGPATLQEEIESLRLFYRDPETSRAPGEQIAVTAPVASSIRGEALFTGAAWYRPDFRKLGVMPTLSILNRAVFHTRWAPNFTFSFMAPELVKGGVAAACRMHRVEYEVTMVKTPVLASGIIPAALIWADRQDNIDVFTEYVEAGSGRADAKIDGMVDNRATDQKRAG